MKKAYNLSEELCHSELVSESQKTLKQVQGDRIKAFTLAEIMIVLSVIAVLTAILLPAARNAMPNEDLMKFKKAHNTITTAIREIVNSDDYYLDGNLGVKPNGDAIDGSHEGDNAYFCETLADILNAKSKACETTIDWTRAVWGYDTPEEIISQDCDTHCSQSWENEQRIVSLDGFDWYESCPNEPFGISYDGVKNYERKNNLGMYHVYKCICADIDGRNNGLEPFSWGVRIDGRVINGKRVNEWLSKSIQEKN